MTEAKVEGRPPRWPSHRIAPGLLRNSSAPVEPSSPAGATLSLLLALSGCASAPASHAPSGAAGQPYAGLDERENKALSAEQVEGPWAGRGAGYALAAELNHYPGPTRALELADELDLSGQQHRDIATVKAAMLEQARRLGAELEAAFASAELDQAELAEIVAATADAEGRLRPAHLAAPIETRALLSRAQVAHYHALRGYAVPGASAAGHDGGHHGGD